MASPYEVLGVEPDADDEAVRTAYRRRAKETHPDQGGSAEEFQRVQTAYARIQAGNVDDVGVARHRSGDPDADGTEEAAGPDDHVEGTHVEYLDYETLVDHGWDLDDGDLFKKAAAADLETDAHGEFRVGPNETLLEAAEDDGNEWPFACRGGACTNCAVAVHEGAMPTPPGHILPQDLLERGIRLSCISAPTSDELKVVYNVKHLPGVDELRLPASRFRKTYPTD